MKFTGVRPQRHNGRGWIDCDIHAAQQWAAFYNSALVGRYATKARANQMLASEHIRRSTSPRSYRLGARMPKRELMS
jgi:hypothetical protein